MLAAAAAAPAPSYRLPAMAAPKIDGIVDAEEWKGAVRSQRYSQLQKIVAFPARAEYLVGYDRDNLYLAARCETGPAGILRRVKPRSGNALAMNDDSFECIFIDDLAKGKDVRIRHLIVNAIGAAYGQGSDAGRSVAWKPEGMKVASTVTNGVWSFEMAIPRATVGYASDAAVHGLRFCRNWRRIIGGYEQQSSDAQGCGGYFTATHCPELRFDADAPVVQVVEAGGPGERKDVYPVRVKVTNPTTKPLALKVSIHGKAINSQPGVLDRELTLAAGGSELCEMEGPILGDEKIDLTIAVTSGDGAKTYYFRNLTVEPNSPVRIFRDVSVDASRLALRFAYYPSYSKIRAVADLGNLGDAAQGRTATVVIRDARGDELARVSGKPDKDGVFERIFDVPDLKARTLSIGKDDYTITLSTDVTADGSAQQSFKRTVFEWEGNKYGLSDLVPPPFERIKVQRFGGLESLESCKPVELEKDSVVKVVLRNYTIGDYGLWKQVNAAGKDILARPMTLQTSQTSQTFQTSQTYDVDGMMDWRLTLKPGRYEPMALEIPLRAERAKLLHACADGMRYNYGGEVPAGEGRVWESGKAPRTSIIGSYLPYIWVGGPLRGLAVFGESDRGWVTDGKTPCQEIVREKDGTVVLKLNLIQRPVDLKDPQTIHLAFQATPVKPMPENWRGKHPGALVGACLYWGAYSAFCDVEPYDGTDAYLRKMAEVRKTGKIDRDFVERYIRDYPNPFPKDSKAWAERNRSITAHYHAGMNMARNDYEGNYRGGMTFYTNARGVTLGNPSGTTFCDEWTRGEFSSRPFASREACLWYDLDPCASYRDYAAWWWRKMFDSDTCRNIYWDDVFLQSNFDLVGTEAYRLPSGEIQPASGVFNMRALIRRCFILKAELGRDPLWNWVHMTNTEMAPVMAFAGFQYDWEDNGGTEPFQVRYSRASIQAQSLGRQYGNKVGIMGYFSKKSDEHIRWLARTGTGVLLTHELEWFRPPDGTTVWKETYRRVQDWGYGKDDTDVWNYWDEDVVYPVAIAGLETSSLAMARKAEKKALVVVCNYEHSDGSVCVKPDSATLGLPKDYKAYDFETGAEIPLSGGAASVSLPAYDFKIVRFE